MNLDSITLTVFENNVLTYNVNLNNVKQFPQVNMIFDKFCQGLWVNQRNAKKCYKYIVFGKRVKDKIFAVTIMRHIVCDILLASQIK